jgi:hypothetical protein
MKNNKLLQHTILPYESNIKAATKNLYLAFYLIVTTNVSLQAQQSRETKFRLFVIILQSLQYC